MGFARAFAHAVLVAASLVIGRPPPTPGVGAPHAASPRQDAGVVDTTPVEDERPLLPGVLRAGQNISVPTVVRQVDPRYTSDAKRHDIHGIVRLDCLVRTDGTVADVRVVRSLDRVYGLDEEAIDAAKQWKFEPSVKDGVAVPVMVTLEMTFEMSTPLPASRNHR